MTLKPLEKLDIIKTLERPLTVILSLIMEKQNTVIDHLTAQAERLEKLEGGEEVETVSQCCQVRHALKFDIKSNQYLDFCLKCKKWCGLIARTKPVPTPPQSTQPEVEYSSLEQEITSKAIDLAISMEGNSTREARIENCRQILTSFAHSLEQKTREAAIREAIKDLNGTLFVVKGDTPKEGRMYEKGYLDCLKEIESNLEKLLKL